MSIHTQKIDVETAASPCGPMRVPTQYASTVANSVMSSVDATAGSATAATVLVRDPLTSEPTVSYSPVIAVARPSRGSIGNAAAGVVSGGRVSTTEAGSAVSLTSAGPPRLPRSAR